MINDILIRFFDKFKSSNPQQFTLLVIALTAFNLLLANGEFVALLGAPKWLNTAVMFVSLLYTAVKGVDTKSLMKDGK
jgi:uncharacterized membrane protein